MAVPIPGRTNRTRKGSADVADQGLRLEYAGKKPAAEILATPPGRYAPHPKHGGKGDNRIYHGDNLHVLSALLRDKSIAGQVKLVYIDPPFATDAKFESRTQAHAYDDHLIGAEFVECLRERLILIHQLLADDGSVY